MFYLAGITVCICYVCMKQYELVQHKQCLLMRKAFARQRYESVPLWCSLVLAGSP